MGVKHLKATTPWLWLAHDWQMCSPNFNEISYRQLCTVLIPGSQCWCWLMISSGIKLANLYKYVMGIISGIPIGSNIGLGWKPTGQSGGWRVLMKGERLKVARSDMKSQDVWNWEIGYPKTAMMSQFVVIKHSWDWNKVIRLNWAVQSTPGRIDD